LGQQLSQLIATGITTGAVYALLGLGLTLTYSTTRVVNVAIGEFAMIGALSAVSMYRSGLPLIVALVGAVLLGAAVAGAMYLFTIRPGQRRGASLLTLLIVTIAMHLALRGIGLIIWGTRSYNLPSFTRGDPLRVLNAVITRQSLWILGLTALIVLGLYLFFSRTLLGKALRASAVNALGSRLMGIPVYRMGLLAFALSGALAAAGGVLITPETLATYDMGLLLGLKGFVGAVIGRLSSYPLTVAGCLLLGLLESLSAGLLPSGYRDAVAFGVLILILIYRALPALRHGVLAAEEAHE
jgi:branched-chain amino acid transport system permease protein